MKIKTTKPLFISLFNIVKNISEKKKIVFKQNVPAKMLYMGFVVDRCATAKNKKKVLG